MALNTYTGCQIVGKSDSQFLDSKLADTWSLKTSTVFRGCSTVQYVFTLTHWCWTLAKINIFCNGEALKTLCKIARNGLASMFLVV